MAPMRIYQQKLKEIYQRAREKQIAETDIDEALRNSFRVLEKREKKRSLSFRVKSVLAVLFTTIACFVFFDKKFLAVLLLRNLQNSIYPGLKMVRKISVPIIRHYPSLSEFYDEWCILENPFFYVHDMDCWPCSVVHFVPDLTGHRITRSLNPAIPYVKAENLTEVRVRSIRELVQRNRQVFDKETSKVVSNNATYRNIQDALQDSSGSKNSDNHVTWRVNRMAAGRVLRKLFPKPADVPNWWEPSTEKFLFLDESKSPPYSLPNPECSNAMIRCASGGRLIKLIASPECSASCYSQTILLTAGNTLWYNWWYWRPVSLPALNTTSISISYVTSFC